MILVPAIDILDGATVRLTQGSFEQPVVYEADPVDAALRWCAEGARALHVVDLDGAKAGGPVNLAHVRRIVEQARVPVQVGGGLRSIESIEQVLDAGAHRVVLGTAAFDDLDLLDAAVERLGSRLAVSVDVRDGRLATRGWTSDLEIPVEVAMQRLGERGVRRFVYSSIDRDGTLTGPDLQAARSVARVVRGSFLYSGGIASLEDLEALAGLRQVNLTGVIVGTALYEQRFTLREGQQALQAAGPAPEPGLATPGAEPY